MAATVATKTPFAEFVKMLQRVKSAKGTENKKKPLREYIALWRKRHEILHGKPEATDAGVKAEPETKMAPVDSFFPALRLLLPQLDRDRDAYGMKENTIGKYYIDILGLGKESQAAKQLLNYRNPKKAGADAGDFADVVYSLLKSRCPEKGDLFLGDLNERLDEIAKCHANKNVAAIKKHLMYFLTHTSALEHQWLVRIVLKDLKLKIGPAHILDSFHEDAEDLYNVKMSLQKVCEELHDPKTRLHELGVSLHHAFRPMLGDRGRPNRMEKAMQGRPFYIEVKFDGERAQLHKQGDEYKFFSRNGHDYTHVFGANPFDGNFVPHIHNLFKPHVRNCILDGEFLLYEPDTKTVLMKSDKYDVKNPNLEGYHPCLYVFDILLLNDQVLTNKPLSERKDVLKGVFADEKGWLEMTLHREGRSNEDAINALNAAIDEREEGVMIKDPRSVYKPNTRKGGWYKLKPDYLAGVMDDLDLLVLGGYFGTGSRANNMPTHFLCGVVAPGEPRDKPEKFWSFCKVGSGYSKTELQEILAKLAPNLKVFDKKKPPAHLELSSGLKQKPDVWVAPSESIIIQVRAAEITDSEQFRTGVTLRFPRVETVRDDKGWTDCMTYQELTDLREACGGRLAARHLKLDDDDDDSPTKKRRKVVKTTVVKPTLDMRFRPADVSDVVQSGDAFADKEICVLSGTEGVSKTDLERGVTELGGTFSQHPCNDTYCVVVGKMSLKAKNILRTEKYDVLHADWLIRCIKDKVHHAWLPFDMLQCAPGTAAEFAKFYDKHGDSFTKDVSEDELREIFRQMSEKNPPKEAPNDVILAVQEAHMPDYELGLFRVCTVYVDRYAEVGDPDTKFKTSSLDLAALELRFHGALLTSLLTDDVTHVVLSARDASRLTELQRRNRKRGRKFHLVTDRWVSDCVEQGRLLTERRYHPET